MGRGVNLRSVSGDIDLMSFSVDSCERIRKPCTPTHVFFNYSGWLDSSIVRILEGAVRCINFTLTIQILKMQNNSAPDSKWGVISDTAFFSGSGTGRRPHCSNWLLYCFSSNQKNSCPWRPDLVQLVEKEATWAATQGSVFQTRNVVTFPDLSKQLEVLSLIGMMANWNYP